MKSVLLDSRNSQGIHNQLKIILSTVSSGDIRASRVSEPDNTWRCGKSWHGFRPVTPSPQHDDYGSLLLDNSLNKVAAVFLGRNRWKPISKAFGVVWERFHTE